MQPLELIKGQAFSSALIAGALRTTKAEIADTLGLNQDALPRATRVRARKTLTRLREMVEIPRRVKTYTGCRALVAYACCRSEALPGLRARHPIIWCAKVKPAAYTPTLTGSWPTGMPDTLNTLSV